MARASPRGPVTGNPGIFIGYEHWKALFAVPSSGRHYLLFQALEGTVCCSELWKAEGVVTRLETAMIALTDLVRAMIALTRSVRAMIALTRSVRAIIALTDLVRAVIIVTELGTAFWLFQSL